MKRVLAVSAVCLIAASMSYGQCDDNYDANLCVYPMPAADTEFKMDGQQSAFWNNWTGDYITMDNTDNCYPGRCNFTGTDDATITIKAAATQYGLYVLSTVKDNTWVDKAAANDWGADAIDFYFDGNDANTLFTCTDCLIGLYASKLSYKTQQFQVWMGNSVAPTGCQFQHYDETAWSWQEMGLAWDALKTLYGIEIDIISIDATTKAQEWFFPWEKFGGGLDIGLALDGKKFGFSGGYNDQDGDNPAPDCLRWLKKDPWAEDASTVNYWGDFVVQAGVGTVLHGKIDVKKNAAAARMAAKVSSNEFYNLQGQRVSAPTQNVVKGAVLVQRAGGQANVRMVSR